MNRGAPPLPQQPPQRLTPQLSREVSFAELTAQSRLTPPPQLPPRLTASPQSQLPPRPSRLPAQPPQEEIKNTSDIILPILLFIVIFGVSLIVPILFLTHSDKDTDTEV